MSTRQRLLRWAAAPHRARRTVRMRLTLLYSGLFLASGAVLLAITYGLVQRATDDGTYVYRGSNGNAAVIESPRRKAPDDPADTTARSNNGNSTSLSPGQLRAQARRIKSLAKQQHADQLHELLVQSAVALGIMTIASLALGWFIAGRVLRPLRSITQTARHISATNLHERIAIDGPNDELKELGDTIDDLLARLERAFAAHKQFVANASHELRTPLARQRIVAQVALANPDATIDSLRAAHERVLATGQQQERFIDALLTLTRGQAGLARQEHFDLTAVTERIMRDRSSEAAVRHLHVNTTLEPASVSGDPSLTECLVTNLIDNALRHTCPDGRIHITTRTTNGHATLSVTNDGPNIPPTELPRLFQPLQRLDPGRTSNPDGHGLGLSIVQAIADAHHATITARARPEGGLTIDVHFPALPHDIAGHQHLRSRSQKRGIPCRGSETQIC
jgi:signal transduction histidine kinase